MSQHPKTLTAEERDRLRILIASGATTDQAALALGRLHSACHKWAIRMGLEPRRVVRIWTDRDDAALIRLHSDGATHREMADALDRSIQAVEYRRRVLDLANPAARAAQTMPEATPPAARADPWDCWQAANARLRTHPR